MHDGLGRLVEVLKDGVSQVRYGYTADGRLAWRREVAAGRTVWYVHDGRQVIQEIQTAPSTVLLQEYCWQETTLLETRKPGGWIRTLHQDRLGSVVAATAGGGGTVTIEARTAYDPYGRPVSLPSPSAAGVEAIVPFGYTGARWEDLAALDVDADADGTVESVGLYAMGARWYDAEMGRFLEQDPLGEVAGSNLYAYVDASPVMWVDPSGLLRSHERNKAAVDFYDRLSPFTMGARAMAASLTGGRRNARSKTEAGRKYEDAQRFARYMKAWGADFEDQARAQVGMGAILSLTVMGETSDGKLALMWTVESGATRQPGEVGSSLASGGSGGNDQIASIDLAYCEFREYVPGNVAVTTDPDTGGEPWTQAEAEQAVCVSFRYAMRKDAGRRLVTAIEKSKKQYTIEVGNYHHPGQTATWGESIEWNPRNGLELFDKNGVSIGSQSPAHGLMHEFAQKLRFGGQPTAHHEPMAFDQLLSRELGEPVRSHYYQQNATKDVAHPTYAYPRWSNR